MGWQQRRSVGICGVRPALPEGVGSWKEIDVGRGCYRQRGGRVMRETRVGEAELGGDRHFEGNWGLHFCDGYE